MGSVGIFLGCMSKLFAGEGGISPIPPPVQKTLHSLHHPFCWRGGGGVQPLIKFSKRGAGLDKISIFTGGCTA